eukprot:15435103-Alexandrium_andersonii.AAC.1
MARAKVMPRFVPPKAGAAPPKAGAVHPRGVIRRGKVARAKAAPSVVVPPKGVPVPPKAGLAPLAAAR